MGARKHARLLNRERFFDAAASLSFSTRCGAAGDGDHACGLKPGIGLCRFGRYCESTSVLAWFPLFVEISVSVQHYVARVETSQIVTTSQLRRRIQFCVHALDSADSGHGHRCLLLADDVRRRNRLWRSHGRRTTGACRGCFGHGTLLGPLSDNDRRTSLFLDGKRMVVVRRDSRWHQSDLATSHRLAARDFTEDQRDSSALV